MAKAQPDGSENAESTCAACLLANLRRQTSDTTALSDVLRPHRAFRRGSDRVYGESFSLPVKIHLSADDFDEWDRLMSRKMKPGTLAVYRATIANGQRGLTCPHGGWGESGHVDFRGGPDGTEPERGPAPEGRPVATYKQGFTVDLTFGASNQSTLLFASRSDISSGTGFKISVAQKSLSLALKHSWVHGAIDLPPVCPVDRIILNEASKITGRSWYKNWTEVNEIEDYESHVALLVEAAEFRSIAAWELLTFENHLPRTPRAALDTDAELERDRVERLPAAAESFVSRFSVPVGDARWPEVMLSDALKSSLQHNPTYLPTTPEYVRVEVRKAMRCFIVEFLRTWSLLPTEQQTLDAFKQEVLRFRDDMNTQFRRWFR